MKTHEPPPRLGVGHMLLWVGCCAVYLMLVRRTGTGGDDWRRMVIYLLHVVGHGAALAGLLLVGLREWRGSRWLIEPGLGLLAAFGAVAVARVVLGMIPRDMFYQDEVVLDALLCCLLVVPALSRDTPAVWKTAFCLLAVVVAVPLLASVAQLVSGPGNYWGATVAEYASWCRLPVCSSIVGVAVVIELRRGTRRSWLHWVGVVGLIWILALPTAELEF